MRRPGRDTVELFRLLRAPLAENWVCPPGGQGKPLLTLYIANIAKIANIANILGAIIAAGLGPHQVTEHAPSTVAENAPSIWNVGNLGNVGNAQGFPNA